MSPENVWISRMTLSGRNIFLKISQTSPVWTCPCLSVRKTYEKHISIEEEKSHRKGNKWRERINEQERKRKQEKSSLVRWRTFIDAVAIDGIDNGSMSVSFGRARATISPALGLVSNSSFFFCPFACARPREIRRGRPAELFSRETWSCDNLRWFMPCLFNRLDSWNWSS